MAMQIERENGHKATEKQMKYLGVLSRQGKELFGKEFSIRNLASQLGYSWPPSFSEASELIDKVKHMLEEQQQGFEVTTQDLIDELAEKIEKKPEPELKQEHQPQPEPQQTTTVYMIQLFVDDSKLKALEIVLDAMGIGYIAYKEA